MSSVLGYIICVEALLQIQDKLLRATCASACVACSIIVVSGQMCCCRAIRTPTEGSCDRNMILAAVAAATIVCTAGALAALSVRCQPPLSHSAADTEIRTLCSYSVGCCLSHSVGGTNCLLIRCQGQSCTGSFIGYI